MGLTDHRRCDSDNYQGKERVSDGRLILQPTTNVLLHLSTIVTTLRVQSVVPHPTKLSWPRFFSF